MRMNENSFEQVDVYSDVSTPYSATYFGSENSEFSLESVQQKLGMIPATPVEEKPVVNNGSVNTDVMPTQQTLTMNYQRDYKSQAATGKKVSTKVKVAAICYATAVLVLVLGIALTSVAVSGIFTETLALTANYETIAAQVAAIEEQLSVEDQAALKAQAAELGYVNASEVNAQTYYERIETRPAQNFNIETNWFDSLCDWLSGAFGG